MPPKSTYGTRAVIVRLTLILVSSLLLGSMKLLFLKFCVEVAKLPVFFSKLICLVLRDKYSYVLTFGYTTPLPPAPSVTAKCNYKVFGKSHVGQQEGEVVL